MGNAIPANTAASTQEALIRTPSMLHACGPYLLITATYLIRSNIGRKTTHAAWVTCITPRPAFKRERWLNVHILLLYRHANRLVLILYSKNYFVPLCLIVDSPPPCSFLQPFFISFSFLYTFFWFRIPWLSLIPRLCARGLGMRLCRGYLQFEGDGLVVGHHEVELLDVVSGSYQVLGHDTYCLLHRQ